MNDIQRFYKFGDFCVHAQERLLLRREKLVPLAPKAFDTLLVLVENRGRVVEKDELMKEVWPTTFVEESNLANIIAVLRKALGDSRSKDKYIQTIPRRGYRFAAGVTLFSHTQADAEHRCEPLLRRRPSHFQPDQSPAGEVTEEGGEMDLTSIAVLPFRSIGQNGHSDALELGIADALITRLSKTKRLVMFPTSTTLKYNTPRLNPVAIGRKLKVEGVLEGSVQRFGGRVRVIVQLLSTQDGSALWAEKLEDDLNDLFAVQDRVSEWVAEALMLRLTREERKLLKQRYTENSEAYQAYLKGRYFCDKRNIEGLRKSIEYFQKAIDIDPNYALAYNGLTHSYNLMGHYGFMPPGEASAKAKEAALKGLALDDSLSEGHVSSACIKLFDDWDWPGAEKALKKAFELNEHDATAHQVYSYYLNTLGRFEESLVQVKRAQQLDPLSLTITASVGLPYFFGGQYRLAIEMYKKAVDLDPTFWLVHAFLAEAYCRAGDYDRAISEIQQARQHGNTVWALAKLGAIYASSGMIAQARGVIAELEEISEREYVCPYFIAVVYSRMAATQPALEWLEKAYDEKAPWMVYLMVDPAFELVRDKPEFIELQRRVGFKV